MKDQEILEATEGNLDKLQRLLEDSHDLALYKEVIIKAAKGKHVEALKCVYAAVASLEGDKKNHYRRKQGSTKTRRRELAFRRGVLRCSAGYNKQLPW